MSSRYTNERFRGVYEMRKNKLRLRDCDIAKAIKVSNSTMSRYLGGGVLPYDTLRQLFKILEYSDEDIVEVMRLGV